MPIFFALSFVCRRLAIRVSARSPKSPCSAGFTLLELLTVLAIVAILAGLAIGVGRRVIETGNAARAKAELATLVVALEEYHRICGDYPQTTSSAQLLQSLIGRRGPGNEVVALRHLIELGRFVTEAALDPFSNSAAVLIDPWGQRYHYAHKSQVPWNNYSYVLYSSGPDGRDSPALLTGGWCDPAPPENVDNIVATHN